MDETVTISKKEYEDLKKAEAHLDYLHEQGVDNWGGYGYPEE